MTDPPTDLLLVRHGQAVCNVTGVVGGPRSCTGLTPLGREQARQLAARLNGGEPVTVMYTAPRLRVQETAQIIGSTSGWCQLSTRSLTAPTTVTPTAARGPTSRRPSAARLSPRQIARSPPAPRPGTTT